MNVIIPLNIQALRVNNNDATGIVGNFQGQTAAFENMPYNPSSLKSSTGDEIYTPLTVPPSQSPANPLRTGIHIHWNLPEYFKKGKQHNEKEKIVFPQVPNRWLVTRYLSILNDGSYGEITTKSWVVESDYLSKNKPSDNRPYVSVPLAPASGGQSHMYMGRVVDYEDWSPTKTGEENYLSDHKDAEGNPMYLNSIGFVGSYFSSYYPECSSVFGFWDNFSDNTDVQTAIENNIAIQFRVSYSVIGWIDNPSLDPVNSFASKVIDNYNAYVEACQTKGVNPDLTPKNFFATFMQEETKWSYNEESISYTLDKTTGKIKTLTVPTNAICSGIIQEVVWIMKEDDTSAYFLAEATSHGSQSAVWSAKGTVSIGNTTVEALSTQLKTELSSKSEDENILKDYEFMLDALQLGMLKDIEKTPDILISLEEKLHSESFNHHNGGLVWNIANKNKSVNSILDKSIAKELHTLNEAQKAYDMARFGLFLKRKQLFMDWFRYIKMYVAYEGGGTMPYNKFSFDDIQTFLGNATNGEISDVINKGNNIGLLTYTKDGDGKITGMYKPADKTTTAYAVWSAFNDLSTLMIRFSNLVLYTESLDSFHTPSEPVILLESNVLDPKQRKPVGGSTFVRFTEELLSEITIKQNTNSFTVKASQISNIPTFASNKGLPIDVQDLINETYLLCPMLASSITLALSSQGGANNPAVGTGAADFTTSLMYAQGGLSPLDLQPNACGIPPTTQLGLYEIISQNDYNPLSNNSVKITSPITIDFTFTNSNGNGRVMSPFGWNTQNSQKQLSSTRVDPFVPLFIVWNIEFDPLKNSEQTGYGPKNISEYFEFDHDQIDYQYLLSGGNPVSFTNSKTVNYSYSTTISSNAAGSLINEIQSYILNNADDPDLAMLQDVINKLKGKKLLSQRLDSFNDQQLLTFPVAAIEVKNVAGGLLDQATPVLQTAANNSQDSWYKHQFNRLSPVTLDDNFNPLRSGFLTVKTIEIVDVFGQRVDIIRDSRTNKVICTPSYSLSRVSGDKTHKNDAFLPPRLLVPTRLWFKWISAENRLTEMTKNPTTNPIYGWVLPNHLDVSIVFYNADGIGIGSFSISGDDSLTYKTWPGNLKNRSNSLTIDIGAQGSPPADINPFIADFMWYISVQNVQFFKDLMDTIQKSESANQPKDYQESEALSVLIGRPLALVRTVLGLETSGNLLPLDQSGEHASSPFSRDVKNGHTNYEERMPHSSAQLSSVEIPVQLGNLTHFDDGLVGYIIETGLSDPYKGTSIYAPTASNSMNSGVIQPELKTLMVQLNQAPVCITLLMDPRSNVHATTGILPVKKLKLPANFYKSALREISVSFYARPILKTKNQLNIPIPSESGYGWEWIVAEQEPKKIKPQEINEVPNWGYSKQNIFEGWLNLKSENE